MRVVFRLREEESLGYSEEYFYSTIAFEWGPFLYTPTELKFINYYPFITAQIEWTMLDGKPL